MRPSENGVEELALVKADHKVPVLLPLRQVHRRVAGSVRHVEQVDGTDADEHVGDLLMALQGSPVDGRHALVVAMRDVGRAREEPLHCAAMALVASPMEACTAPIVLLLHADASKVHPLHDWGIVILRQDDEGCETIAVALREQAVVPLRHGLERMDVGRLGRPMHRRFAGGIPAIGSALSLQELRQDAIEAEPRGPMQRCVAIHIGGIGVKALVEHLEHGLLILRLCRLGQGLELRGSAATSAPERHRPAGSAPLGPGAT
mmetsp:Transcript_69713/g.149139  ORF Transcript_69713/g.149139 Transcript_69713/m.149139 type:complete len:261 (-) Transcript_69713:2-784(-)